MTESLLRVDGMSFSYPERHVFTQWSARFAPGLTWLRGGNGSGKSTLLKLLAGVLPPLTGRVAVAGIDIAADPLAYRREVFWCGPGAIAFDHLRPEEFFGFMQSLYPRFDTQGLAAQLQGFALQPHLGQRLNALSTGTQRKVWISAALSAGSRVVLLDEPMNALDAASLAWLHGQLLERAASRSQAWLVASHEGLGPAQASAVLLEL
jgi:ABC-type multidrug transport system ATPase subunit